MHGCVFAYTHSTLGLSATQCGKPPPFRQASSLAEVELCLQSSNLSRVIVPWQIHSYLVSYLFQAFPVLFNFNLEESEFPRSNLILREKDKINFAEYQILKYIISNLTIPSLKEVEPEIKLYWNCYYIGAIDPHHDCVVQCCETINNSRNRTDESIEGWTRR